ncbi:hypothetical protein [Rhizobium rhizogenes]|nr:hypothetical protein [Rhizobium rhizogenes]
MDNKIADQLKAEYEYLLHASMRVMDGDQEGIFCDEHNPRGAQ